MYLQHLAALPVALDKHPTDRAHEWWISTLERVTVTWAWANELNASLQGICRIGTKLELMRLSIQQTWTNSTKQIKQIASNGQGAPAVHARVKTSRFLPPTASGGHQSTTYHGRIWRLIIIPPPVLPNHCFSWGFSWGSGKPKAITSLPSTAFRIFKIFKL